MKFSVKQEVLHYRSICVSFTKSKLLLMKKRHLSATEKVK